MSIREVVSMKADKMLCKDSVKTGSSRKLDVRRKCKREKP